MWPAHEAGDDLIALGLGIDSANGGDDLDTLRMDWSGISDPNAGISLSYIGSGWNRYAANHRRPHRLCGDRALRSDRDAGNDNLLWRGAQRQPDGQRRQRLPGRRFGRRCGFGGRWAGYLAGRYLGALRDHGHQPDDPDLLRRDALSGIEQLHFTGGSGVDNLTALAGVYDDNFSTGDGNDIVRTGHQVDSASEGLGTLDTLVMDWSAISDARRGSTLTLHRLGLEPVCLGQRRSPELHRLRDL